MKSARLKNLFGIVTAMAVVATAAVAMAPAASAKDMTFTMSATVSMRWGPSTNYDIMGSVVKGSKQTFMCYQIGTPVGGDSVWGLLSAWNGGYVPDKYINIGGKTLAQAGLPKCKPITSSTRISSLTTTMMATVPTRLTPSTSGVIYTTNVIVAGSTPNFVCYTTGTSVHGDNIWGGIIDYHSKPLGFVPDYYIRLYGGTLDKVGLLKCNSGYWGVTY